MYTIACHEPLRGRPLVSATVNRKMREVDNEGIETLDLRATFVTAYGRLPSRR